jgi:uncharacterized protein with FMN-binding domain
MLPRRGAVALSLTALALILLGNFKTPDASGVALASTVAAPGGATAGPTTPAGTSTTSGTTAAAGTGRTSVTTVTSATASYTGTAIQTRYGVVQVQVTIANGKLTGVTTLQAPSGVPHSSSISAAATPVLASEALTAQSAKIDTVSGATFTSQGYLASLQSALDQAAAA